MESQDTVSYSSAMSSEDNNHVNKPYLKKELIYQIDNNGGPTYDRNQVTFETIGISNNGKFADYKNAFISIPVCVTLSRDAHHATAAEGPTLINFKGSNTILIDSLTVSYGNDSIIQQNSNINAFCAFKQHTEFSINDALINDYTGYRLDSTDWTYTAVSGLVNNTFTDYPCKTQSADEALILTNANVLDSGENYYSFDAATNTHVYRYDCIIRLKDLLFFEKMPLVRGGNVKITLDLNQSSTSVNTLKGSSNFVLRSNEGITAGVAYDETITLKVVTNNGHQTKKSECRLYVPVYIMSPKSEALYLEQGVKTIIYSDLFVKMEKGLTGDFQRLLTNSLSRMKRLVIVPMLSQHTAGGVDHCNPQEGLYSTEPATCSPYFLQNFNLQMSGSNIYSQSIDYKYESFLNEMNGVFGLNSNMETGSTSSLISMKQYNSNMGYIVVDLSRRFDYDENVPLSISIQGKISSPKALDFLCFIEYEKTIKINLLTGAKEQ